MLLRGITFATVALANSMVFIGTDLLNSPNSSGDPSSLCSSGSVPVGTL